MRISTGKLGCSRDYNGGKIQTRDSDMNIDPGSQNTFLLHSQLNKLILIQINPIISPTNFGFRGRRSTFGGHYFLLSLTC